MEHIRQAVERARGATPLAPEQTLAPIAGPAPTPLGPADGYVHRAPDQEFDLNPAHLALNRIIGFDTTHPQVTAYDMLRTQVLQTMDKKAWHLLSVISATAGCGKTLTAINLALSIARQPERPVLLVDLDFQKPRVATDLGLPCDQGLIDVLDGRCRLADAIMRAYIGGVALDVLPMGAAEGDSSHRAASRAMAAVVQEIRSQYRSSVVIFDTSPMLLTADAISILPHMDCALFVAAVGVSTTSEIKECNKFLQTTEIVRIVLNKVEEAAGGYYGYGNS